MTARQWALLGGLAVLWGASFFFSKVALAELPFMPVIALLLGWLLLGERVTGSALAGMALIFCGLLAIDGRPRRRRRIAVDPRARSTPA